MPGEPAIVFLFIDLRLAAEHSKNFMSHDGVNTQNKVKTFTAVQQFHKAPHSDTPSIPSFINPVDSCDILMLLEHLVRT